MYTIKLNFFYTVLKLILQKNHTLEETTNCIMYSQPTQILVELLEAKTVISMQNRFRAT